MRVTVMVVELATLYEALRKRKKIEVEFHGKTVRDLIDVLVGEFGTDVRKALLDERDDFKTGIRVFLNGTIYPVETVMQAVLKEGNRLTFQTPS
jgi:hypothetical protein